MKAMATYPRRTTRQIHVGKVAVGGGAPVSVQSMTITKTADVEGTLQQIYALAAAGCDIVRCTCNEAEAAEGLEEDTDLTHLADELPEPSDLMESEDDAPIIKLINEIGRAHV